MAGTSDIYPATRRSFELTFPVPWGVIAAKAWGDPVLPPVLMVHGIQDNAGTFDRIMPYLPNAFYYVCIDLPGHGKSSMYPNGMFMDFMLYVSAIRRVVLQLDWPKYRYIGHSFGGQLGTYYAAMYPDEVIKLVMFDTLCQDTVPVDKYLKYCQKGIQSMIDLERKLLNSSPPNYTHEEALRRLKTSRKTPITTEAVEALSKRSLKENNKNFYYFSMDQRLKLNIRTPTSPDIHMDIIARIECPVLIVITDFYVNYVRNYRMGHSDHSSLQLFQNKPNFEIVPVPGNHDVHSDSPEIVAPHVNKFLLETKSHL